MPWTTNDITQFISLLIRKNQSGSFRDNDITLMWNNQQSAVQQDLIGRYQTRNNARFSPNTGMVEDQTVATLLQPFYVPGVIIPINNSKMLLPADFLYHRALLINGQKVTQFNEDQEWLINGSVIDPATDDPNDGIYYYSEIQGVDNSTDSGAYLIKPGLASGQAVLHYIQQAPDIKYVTKPDANNLPVYDDTNSINPKWRQNMIIEITKRTLKEWGVSFKDSDFEQYGQSVITQGE